MARTAARRVLDDAVKIIAADVVVVGVTRGGAQYFSTSMPKNSDAEWAAVEHKLKDALSSVRRFRSHYNRKRQHEDVEELQTA
jgi:hypothetical protein